VSDRQRRDPVTPPTTPPTPALRGCWTASARIPTGTRRRWWACWSGACKTN